MKADIVIRNARDLLPFDRDLTIDQILNLFKLLDRDIYMASRTMTTIEAETGRIYTALLWDGTVRVTAGAMVLRESLPWRKALEIEKIAVAKEHQRQGIGRALLEYAIELGTKGGYEEIEVVSHKDYKSEGFYEKCGYAPVYSDNRCVGLKRSLTVNQANTMWKLS